MCIAINSPMSRVVSISIWVWTIVSLDMKWESILILVDLWVLRMVGVGTYQHSLLDGPLLWRWLVTVGWLSIWWLNIAGSEGGAGSGGVTFLLGLSSLQILAFIQIIADLKICKSYSTVVGSQFCWNFCMTPTNMAAKTVHLQCRPIKVRKFHQNESWWISAILWHREKVYKSYS